MTIEAINELKKYTLGRNNTEKVEISVLQLNRVIKALEQEPCEDAISRGVFEQVMWERDVAIGQLKELGYEFGEKIEPCEDCISRQAVFDLAKKGVLVSNGNYKSVCKAINELPSVTQKSESVTEFADRCRECGAKYGKYRKEAKRWKNKWLKAQKSGKWIPVSERLPEFRKEVLTCSNGGFIEIQSLEESYSGYWENQKGDWSDFDEIIAWMPLPKPYEPQESEE